jgi:Lipase C-terminal domain/Lipase (class 2)
VQRARHEEIERFWNIRRACSDTVARDRVGGMRGGDVRARGIWGRRCHAAAGRWLTGSLAAAALLFAAAPAAYAKHPAKRERLPVLLVHGFESAGSNYASQTMRFESNGYPTSWVETLDYNSTAATTSMAEVEKQIEAAIAQLKAVSGKSQVDLVGHSEGTSVDYHYLAESEKAAEHRASVAAYANLDGQEKNPGVPTLAVWAGRCGDATCKPEAKRHMEGAENVFIPNATHVQTSTSETTFQAVYKFFTGKTPKHDITPVKKKATIQLAGKALEFPQNTGLVGDTIEVWPVNSDGLRTTIKPIDSISISDGSEGGGAWGPITAAPYQRYEFALVGSSKTIHVYMEPFVRSDYNIRLLGSVPISTAAGKYPKNSGAVMIRYKELWGNQPGENDELLVNHLELCTAKLCPYEKEVNAYFAFNWEGKEESTLNEEPALSKLPFIQAAQVYIRGNEPADEIVSYQLKSRTGGPLRTMNVPNWEGTKHQTEIFWNDFERLKF